MAFYNHFDLNRWIKSLSSINGKYNVYGIFAYDMYSQLYDACVIPTMMYGAEV